MLASLAKRILYIPASSAKSERIFNTGGNIVKAKRNRLTPRNVESLIVIKENMAILEYFLKYGGYEIEKSEDNGNPFEKIIIEGQERHDGPEEFFNGEKNTEEEENKIYLEDIDDFDADSEDKDVEEDGL